jgi:hypothetical protein
MSRHKLKLLDLGKNSLQGNIPDAVTTSLPSPLLLCFADDEIV